jgi:hypothetical protein
MRFPYSIYRLLLRAEFVAAVLIAAWGVLLRRRAIRKLSFGDYAIVFGGAAAVLLAVSVFNGWVRIGN